MLWRQKCLRLSREVEKWTGECGQDRRVIGNANQRASLLSFRPRGAPHHPPPPLAEVSTRRAPQVCRGLLARAEAPSRLPPHLNEHHPHLKSRQSVRQLTPR